MSDVTCPHCGHGIERIDVPVNARGGPRDSWASPCGHQIDTALREQAYEQGYPPVYIEGVTGVALIAAERHRQITEEGHSPANDADLNRKQLGWAAWAYADAGIAGVWNPDEPPLAWPWTADRWKPGPTAMRCLVKAGSLLAAELDRRLAAGEQP